ncbi:MAG: YraN family protein [Treponema sp.]|nr:YraN family protein [Treponema sp.]
MHRAGKGREGEKLAARALEKAGFRIIARNFRSSWGEVDLIALDVAVMVFIEVKSWSFYGIEDLQYGIDLKKRRRIIETAKYFLSTHREYNEMAVRFGVIFVDPGTGAIKYLASSFTEPV